MLVRLRGLLGDFELRRRTLYEAADLQPVQLEPELIARMLRVALLELPDYQLRGLLRDIDDLGERLDEPALIDRITRSLGRGDLILVREQHAGISPGEVEPPEEDDEDDVIEKLDWIEVLVEDEEHNPVPNVAYKIVLPDGSARNGRTNQHGIVRYDRIPSGTCEFSLVELDAEAWKQA